MAPTTFQGSSQEGLALRLEGRRVLVTGATGDLGRAMVRVLGACGADVAVHYRTQKGRAEGLAEEVRTLGRRAAVVQADVGKWESVLAMRDELAATFGAPDIVVANAVSSYDWTTVLEQSFEDFEGQYQTCVIQAVALAKAFAPAMKAQRWGRIIGINTECAMKASAHTGAYVAAKRGMDGVLRVLAHELGPYQVTVNQVAPGWTVGDRDRESGRESQPSYEASIPLRRRGHDREVAHAVAFLASDLAAFISGVYLPVCGGNVMPAI